MKYSDFYMIEPWMLQEFGWSKSLGAYALIYSWYRSGNTCRYSKTQFAEFLQCSRIQAIRVLNDLADNEYIHRDVKAGASTTYYINEKKAEELKQSTSITNDTSNKTTSIMDDTTTSIMDDTTSITDDTTTSIMDDTQLYNILEKDIRKEGIRIENPQSLFGSFDNVLLTDKQISDLKNAYYESDYLNYIERLSSYKESKGKVYNNDYATLISWMTRDGVAKRDHSMDKYAGLINNFELTEEAKRELDEINKDRPDYLKILKIEDNDYGGQTKYYSDGYIRVYDGYGMMVKEKRIGESGIVWQ